MANTSGNRNQAEERPVPFTTRFIATGFFTGYSPIVPGTAGSLAGLIIYSIPGTEYPPVLIFLILTVSAAGIYVSSEMERLFGKDPPIVVIDEVAGMWVSLLFLPKTILISVTAFFFFRIFDIIKPPPARQAESLRSGWGVMMDDVIAGLYANICVQIILYFLPQIRK